MVSNNCKAFASFEEAIELVLQGDTNFYNFLIIHIDNESDAFLGLAIQPVNHISVQFNALFFTIILHPF